jgi:hypothetical protein
MRRTAVLGLTLIGLLLATAANASQPKIPIPQRANAMRGIDPYWDGSVPITISKAAANTTWVKVHDDSSCSFTGNALFGGRGDNAPGWATWCFDGGLGDSCSTTNAYGGTEPGCWTHYDAHTFGAARRWHVDTYDVYQPGAANSDSSAWCGELGDPDTWVFPPGYGHNYNESMVVNLGVPSQFNAAGGMTLGGVQLYSIELAYDYCFVQMSASGKVDTASWLEVGRFNGVSNPDTTTCRGLGQSYWGTTQGSGIGNGTSPYLCADWATFNIRVTAAQIAALGQNAAESLYVRWYVTSDLAWDDVDGSGGATADTRGAWRVDNISIKGALAGPASHFPPDPARTDAVNFERQVPDCPVGTPLCEPGRNKITFPLLPKADDGSGYWNGSAYVRGKPIVVDLWHLTNTPFYPNNAKTCESSNRWMWASNLTPAGADGNIAFDAWHMRLVSPVFDISPNNPYIPGQRITGNVVMRDEYLCIQQISQDVTDTQARVYDNGNWLDWDGDGFVIIGGCQFWNLGDFDDWTDKVSNTSDSIQYGFDFFDQCDYNAQTPLPCMDVVITNVHRKNTYIVDNLSIGFFEQTGTTWTADPQDLFQDTFARDVYLHPTTKENWELFPGDVREDEDSVSVTVADINGIAANSVILHYRVSTTCGTTWTHENTRPQGSKAAPTVAWFTKLMNFSFPLFPANPPPGRANDGTYRTTLELNTTDFPGTILSGGQLREGTVVEYYFSARDNGATRDTLPDRASNRRTFIHPMWGTERQQEWPFEVTVLPCETNYAGQGNHRVLINNDWYLRTAYDAESDKTLSGTGVDKFPFTSQLYEEALRDLNVKYDRYDNNASQISRGTDTPFYSEPTDDDGMGGIRNPVGPTHRYQSVLWATGRHNTYTVTDSSQIELSNYLLSGANEGNLWLAGQNVCEDETMSGVAEAFNGGAFWRNFLGANLVAQGCDDNGGITQRRFYIRGASDPKYTPFQTYGGWADCPIREQPDAAFTINGGGTGTETVIFNFDNNTSDPVIATAGIRDVQASGNMAITTMWDLGLVTTRAARACITRAILSDFFGATPLPAGSDVVATDCDATGNPVDVTPGNGGGRKFALDQNYPNPFNPNTRIRYSLPKDNMKVELTIFDVSGRQVRTLVNRLESGAEHEIYWDGRNERGEDVSSGVYFYSLKADEQSTTKKMVLLK